MAPEASRLVREEGVKASRGDADEAPMPVKELNCPVCSADFPLSGDEASGEEVYCTYCGAPCRLKGNPRAEDCSLEEDF